MSRKTISVIGNILFVLTMVLAVYILVNNYMVRKSLPPGVFPLNNNRILIYITIGMAILTFILSFFEKGSKQKDRE
jgi:multisubunit Na+/H+ antiporter MnhC subunit